MTDFDKVKNYYKVFDEKNRLINDNSGKLEYYMTMEILEEFSKKKGLFAVQEYIQELIRDDPANVQKIIEAPKSTADYTNIDIRI